MPVGPSPRSGTGRGVVIGVVVTLLLVAGGVGAWFGVVEQEPATPAAAQPSSADAVTGKDLGEEPAPSPVSTPPQPALTEAEALAELEALSAESLAALDLDGRWVAQVASKDVGIVDPLQTTASGNHQFFAVDILAESRAALALAPASQVHVLSSLDFGQRSHAPDGDPYWTTFVDGGFADVEAVRAWCTGAFPELTGEALANACVARRLDPPHD
ncbi:hypothetical protein SAMN05444351_0208 [Geodermatophilus nigrescens]|uniref:Uncharacterized protein n=1 Tax=Geodermatophilus nigrescens TaxID=1070870 RepID=A0A1M5D4E8_9ACTN|nr:hypothetical protein SAMN05444351_0208 [Geodermatophilus nigrescens]